MGSKPKTLGRLDAYLDREEQGERRRYLGPHRSHEQQPEPSETEELK